MSKAKSGLAGVLIILTLTLIVAILIAINIESQRIPAIVFGALDFVALFFITMIYDKLQ